jgi:hypothetical protein
MSQFIEMRHYIRRATLEDINAGIQTGLQKTHEGLKSFCAPVLQYRTKEKVDGKWVWGPWNTTLYVREGDELEPPNDAT